MDEYIKDGVRTLYDRWKAGGEVSDASRDLLTAVHRGEYRSFNIRRISSLLHGDEFEAMRALLLSSAAGLFLDDGLSGILTEAELSALFELDAKLAPDPDAGPSI